MERVHITQNTKFNFIQLFPVYSSSYQSKWSKVDGIWEDSAENRKWRMGSWYYYFSRKTKIICWLDKFTARILNSSAMIPWFLICSLMMEVELFSMFIKSNTFLLLWTIGDWTSFFVKLLWCATEDILIGLRMLNCCNHVALKAIYIFNVWNFCNSNVSIVEKQITVIELE